MGITFFIINREKSADFPVFIFMGLSRFLPNKVSDICRFFSRDPFPELVSDLALVLNEFLNANTKYKAKFVFKGLLRNFFNQM